MNLEFKLEIFEGPLDLLLHLVEKNKIDIYDIPITILTNQYIEYINKMKEADFELASEFMVMAATLLEIKSKMLLPSEEKEDEEVVDPREELVAKLLEYKLYKHMAYELKDNYFDASHVFYKDESLPDEVASYEIPVDTKEVVGDVTLDRLSEIFNSLIARQISKIDPIRSKFGSIKKEEVSLDEKMESIKTYIKSHKKFNFTELLSQSHSKVDTIVSFLAILELMKAGDIMISQNSTFDDIIITVSV